MDGAEAGLARAPTRRLIVGLVLAGALAAPASASAITPRSYTWTGHAATNALSLVPPEDWSRTINWEEEGSPAAPGPNEPTGTLTFPSLLGNAACATEPSTEACYASHNDLQGLSVEKVSIDGGAPYLISGESIALTGADGIEATPHGAGGPVAPTLALPIALRADQQWSVTGGEEGGSLDLAGPITGEGHTLGVTLSAGGKLGLEASAEVGEATIKGANIADTGYSASSNGLFDLTQSSPDSAGELNATDGNAVNVEDASIGGVGSLGPLTLTGGEIEVGREFPEPGTISVKGAVKLDSTSAATFTIAEAGAAAGADYGQLRATGDVELGGSQLTVLIRPKVEGGVPPDTPMKVVCPQLKGGEVDTIISTTGLLRGTFEGVPEGTTIETGPKFEDGCPHQQLRIDYTGHEVTTTVLPIPPVILPPPPDTTTTSTTETTSAAPVRGTAVANGTARLEDGNALVELDCTGAGACEGSLKLVYEKRTKRILRRDGRRPVIHVVKQVMIGAASFSIAKGGEEIVHVHLGAEGERLLHRAGRRGLRVNLSGVGVQARSLVIEAPRPNARHSRRRKRG